MIKQFLLTALLLCLLTPDASVFAQDASVPAEGIEWKPFEEALNAARADKKKIIVDVYAVWCPWCRRLQRDVYSEAEVQRYIDDHFIMTRLDAENREDSLHFQKYILTPAELAQGLGAQGFPTTVFLDSESEYITRLPGFIDAGDFMNILKYIASDAFLNESYEEFAQKQQ